MPAVEKGMREGKPHGRKVARITEACTGCGGSPICIVFCKHEALGLVADHEHYPFRKMRVDPEKCVGCGNCVSRGVGGICLLGCPWDAIQLMAC